MWNHRRRQAIMLAEENLVSCHHHHHQQYCQARQVILIGSGQRQRTRRCQKQGLLVVHAKTGKSSIGLSRKKVSQSAWHSLNDGLDQIAEMKMKSSRNSFETK
jgi:hypothetical protein